MSPFFKGLTSHLHGFRLLAKNREIRRRAFVPLLINIVLFVLGIPLSAWIAWLLVDSWFSGSSWLVEVLTIVVQILVISAVILAGIFLFTLVGTIIAGPFSGPLSEAVERHERARRGLPPLIGAERGIVTDATRSVVYAIGRLFLFLLIYPFIFAVQFIPAVGPVLHPVLAVLYASFVLSIDFSDPVLDRHVETFRDKLRYIWRRKGTYLGFGGGALLMMLIPFLNLLVIPVCIVAGTWLYVEENS